MPSLSDIRLTPIGTVHNAYPAGQKPLTWQGTHSQIEVDPRWGEGLEGLEAFSHLGILCYLHLMQGQEPVLKIRAQRHPQMPLVGFFCTRTPLRPNPISLTIVELVKRVDHVLYVRNLDMFDGTRVLDIKPYLKRGDCHPEATVPEWMQRLWAIHDEQRKAGPSNTQSDST
jgi:tRNA-Thr(GGU) m(6)t(6)A37 methyltransferase TsaA